MLYKTQENELLTTIKNSYYLKNIVRKIGYTLNNKNIKNIKKKLTELNIDTKNLNNNFIKDINKDINKNIIQLNYSKCFKCKIGNIWNGKHLILKTININGNKQSLCPNCCSQILYS
tara:strand:- start:70 stop:420 length:351 start_codon:yes stop_codon:yes gene_type:complete